MQAQTLETASSTRPWRTFGAASAALALWLGALLLFSGSALAGLPTADDADKRIEAATKESPEATAQLWFEGVYLYINGDKQLGTKIIMATSEGIGDDWETLQSTETFRKRLVEQPEIFRSYAKGATPENGYKMDPNAFELVIAGAGEDPYGKGYAVKLQSGGADSPRPMYLRKNDDGVWQVVNFSSLYSGVRKAE